MTLDKQLKNKQKSNNYKKILKLFQGDSIPAWKRDERLMPMVYDLIYKKWGFKIDGREINNILRDGEKTIRVEWEHVGKGTHFRQILKAKETDKQTNKVCKLIIFSNFSELIYDSFSQRPFWLCPLWK